MANGFVIGALLAAAVLGGDFGVASATGEPAVGNRILVTLEVEVLVSAEVVVAHLIQPGQDQETISMSGGESGIFRGAATVPKVDVVVVFEAVRGPGDSALSTPATLTELGLDRALLGDLVAPIEESTAQNPSPDIGVPLLIAIVSGVLSLALIIWWVWSGAGDEDRDDAGDNDISGAHVPEPAEELESESELSESLESETAAVDEPSD